MSTQIKAGKLFKPIPNPNAAKVAIPQPAEAWREVRDKWVAVLKVDCDEIAKMLRSPSKELKELCVHALSFIKRLEYFPDDNTVTELNELTKIVVSLYYYCVMNDAQDLSYLNKFALSCKTPQDFAKLIIPLLEIIDEKLQIQDVKEITAEIRYALVQVLIVFVSFCMSDAKKYGKQITAVYTSLVKAVHLLALVPNLQTMSESPCIQEHHWIAKKNSFMVSALGNFKNLPYAGLKEHLVAFRYAALYYAYRVARVVMVPSFSVGFESTVAMLFDVFARNCWRVENSDSSGVALGQDDLLDVLNVYYVALKYMALILKEGGRLLDSSKDALKRSLKETAKSCFTCCSKVHALNSITSHTILRLFKPLFNLKKLLKNSNIFLNKVLTDFYRANAVDPELLACVSDYFALDALHVEQLVKFLNARSLSELSEEETKSVIGSVVEISNSSSKYMQAAQQYFYGEIKLAKTKEELKFILEVLLSISVSKGDADKKFTELEAVELILGHSFDQAHEELLLTYVECLLNNAVERAKKRNWTLKQKATYTPNTMIKILIRVMGREMVGSFQRKACYMLIDSLTSLLKSSSNSKMHQGILFGSMEWRKLVDLMKLQSFPLDKATFTKKLMDFSKQLIHRNDSLKESINRFKSISETVSEFVLTISDIGEDTLNSILHSITEIAFESDPREVSCIENPLFFGLAIKLLNSFPSEKFRPLITQYLDLLAKVIPGPYENYQVLASVINFPHK